MMLQTLLKVMKSKGLVIAGIVIIIISLIFGAYFAPIYNQAGEFGIGGIDPDQAIPLIIFGHVLCWLSYHSIAIMISNSNYRRIGLAGQGNLRSVEVWTNGTRPFPTLLVL